MNNTKNDRVTASHHSSAIASPRHGMPGSRLQGGEATAVHGSWIPAVPIANGPLVGPFHAGITDRSNDGFVKSCKFLIRAGLALTVVGLQACAEWSSDPVRLETNYGASVRNMITNQIYNPNKAQYPQAVLPDGIEGNKSERELEKAYREDFGRPGEVEKKTSLGVIGRGTGTTGGM